MDRSTIIGIAVALSAIGVGMVLEGGRLMQILQPTAAIIVLGGTLGAVLVQFPLPVVGQALAQLKGVFWYESPKPDAIVQNLLRYSHKARKEGLLALEPELTKIQDPFFKECLMLAIDGVTVSDLRKMMELQLDYRAEKDERIPRVFEAAAGFSPTIGILGAVLGLIHVMQQLQDFDAIGKGIAVAFVSTLYGLGAANLLFLPWAGKLKLRLRDRQIIEEMTLKGVLAIIEGINPHALEMQLVSYVPSAKRPGPVRLGVLPKVVSR